MFPLLNTFTPAIVSSKADMASPLPYKLANPVSYVDYLGPLPDHLILYLIAQKCHGQLLPYRVTLNFVGTYTDDSHSFSNHFNVFIIDSTLYAAMGRTHWLKSFVLKHC